MTDALIFVAALAGMEAVAYVTHRFVMHGPLWSLHRSHHEPGAAGLEWNDLFGLFFAVPSVACIYPGRGPLFRVSLRARLRPSAGSTGLSYNSSCR
jgi:hypothetical protein